MTTPTARRLALFILIPAISLLGCGQKVEAPAKEEPPEDVAIVTGGLDGAVEIAAVEVAPPEASEGASPEVLTAEVSGHDDDSGHHHDAPHGGTLVELGDHFANVELVLDAEAGKLTLYAFDAHVESPVRLPHQSIPIKLALQEDATTYELTLAAKVNPLTGETLGDTSEFVVTNDLLKGQERLDIVIPIVTILEQDFTDVSVVVE